MFGGLISQVQIFNVGVLNMRFKPFTVQGEALGFELPHSEFLLFTTVVL